ncbi:zinc-finger domain-containing protein [Bacillus sp. N9]
MTRSKILKEIDETISFFCQDCFLRSHFKKTFSKTYAHRFCIHQCTVGAEIQKKGRGLLDNGMEKG